MAFKESVKNGFSTCISSIKKGARAVKKGWKSMWNFLEDKSAPLHEIYEVRDFKGFSAYGIWFAVLSIFLGFFVLSINMETMRLVLGASLFKDIGEFFVVVSLICFIIGIFTTTDAGILFIAAGYLLPIVGEILTILWKLVTGQFVTYMATNWIYLVLYAVIAGLVLLTYFKVIEVKWNRLIFPIVMLLFVAFAILTVVLGWPPFVGEAMGEIKLGTAMCTFTYLTDICEFITYLLALSFITVTIFGANDAKDAPITVVKLKEEKEEF